MNLQSSVLQKSYSQFQNPNTFISAPKKILRLEKKVDENTYTIQKLQIEKQESLLLEKRIKKVEVKLKHSETSQKIY